MNPTFQNFSSKKRKISLNNLERTLDYHAPKLDLDKDYDSGATVRIASANELPAGVLGMYIPSSHAILIKPGLSSKEQRFVLAHEKHHSLGEINEDKTDARATADVGYNLRLFRYYN